MRSIFLEEDVSKRHPFNITIPEKSLVNYPKPVWDRFVKFVEDNRATSVEGVAYQDPVNHGWVVIGAGTTEMITVLLAAARGDDLVRLLDEFEKEE